MAKINWIKNEELARHYDNGEIAVHYRAQIIGKLHNIFAGMKIADMRAAAKRANLQISREPLNSESEVVRYNYAKVDEIANNFLMKYINDALAQDCVDCVIDEIEKFFNTPQPAAQPAQPAAQPAASSSLEQMLAAAIAPHIDGKVDEARVIELIKKHAVAREVKITVNENTPVTVKGVTHKEFEKVLKIAAIKNNGKRKNIYLVGATGSGKTYLAEQVATALNLNFYAVSVGLQTTKNDLLGYKDVNGKYVRTQLRDAYENGGVFLLDEVDAGNPNVLTVLNNLTANSVAAFPDKMVKRHEDFLLIASGNTYGQGNDIVYVGRNKLDAATLSRFVFVRVDYDERLELKLASNKDWAKRVFALRRAIAKLGLKIIASPRATYDGADLVNAGFSFTEVEEMLIFQGVDKATVEKIKNKAR